MIPKIIMKAFIATRKKGKNDKIRQNVLLQKWKEGELENVQNI